MGKEKEHWKNDSEGGIKAKDHENSPTGESPHRGPVSRCIESKQGGAPNDGGGNAGMDDDAEDSGGNAFDE